MSSNHGGAPGAADSKQLDRPFITNALHDEVRGRISALLPALANLETGGADANDGLVAMVGAMGSAGLLSWVVDRDHGGDEDGVSCRRLCLAREALAHHSPLADLAFAMQGLGSHPILLAGSGAAVGPHLVAAGVGASVAAFALTEPEAGSDLDGLATTAHLDGDEYVIRGHKTFISNATIADFFTVFAATAPTGARRRLSAFVVPRATRGLTTKAQQVLGGHPIGEVTFDDVRVPTTMRLGGEGDGLGLALGTLSRFRPTVGAAALGFAQRALDEALRHVKTRRQFGAPLADLQAVQIRLADMAVALESARMLVYRAAHAIDGGADRDVVTHMSSMAKLAATEGAQLVIDQAVQLFGGRGVLEDNIVARLYQEVRALRIYEGTSDVHRTLIARHLLAGSRP